MPNGAAHVPGALRRQRHQRGDRRVPGRAGHRRRAGRRREPEGRRDGRHRGPRRADGPGAAQRSRARRERLTSTTRPRPLVLVVLDGFGVGQRPADGRRSPRRTCPSGAACSRSGRTRCSRRRRVRSGCRTGQMGNSEVGHLNLGAGRPVVQDLPRIDAAIADGSFFENAALRRRGAPARRAGHRLHLVGLIGPGGVHSIDRHAVAIARLARQQGAQDVVVHGLLDGRDTPPRSADEFVPDFERRLARRASARAHRDHRRPLLRHGPRPALGARRAPLRRDRPRPRACVPRQRHAGGARRLRARTRTTSSSQPTVIDGVDGTVRDGDVVVHFNFRADRARQLIHALVDGDDFDRTCFDRGDRPRDLLVVTMTEYEEGLPVEVAFPPLTVTSLAEIFSKLGWRQFHVAETEKYAHVTYFFNGGVEEALPGEDRLLVPSPKVATYDLQPEMSAAGRHRRAGRRHARRQVRLHRGQLRQPGHGRPHGRLGRDRRGARVPRRLPRPRRRRAAGGRACCASPPTTATPTRCATPTATR